MTENRTGSGDPGRGSCEMIDDLKPNGANGYIWTPEGVFMVTQLVVLRLRDRLVNEDDASDDVAQALNSAVNLIQRLEVSWKMK